MLIYDLLMCDYVFVHVECWSLSVVHHEFGHYNLLTSLIRSMSVSVSVSYYSMFIHLGFFWGEFCFTGFWFCCHQYLGGISFVMCWKIFCIIIAFTFFNLCLQVPCSLCMADGTYSGVFFWLMWTFRHKKKHKLECGPMPNLMVALPNIGGALCSTPQSLPDAHY